MTAAAPAGTGTPLFLIVLPIVVSALALMVSIVAMLMSRANVRWQMQVTAREAWMLEFREKVAALLAGRLIIADMGVRPNPRPQPLSRLDDALRPAIEEELQQLAGLGQGDDASVAAQS
jgi:hypothetical protein